MENVKVLLNKIFLYKSTLIVVLILILAAFLRLYRISDYITFLGDEGRDLLAVSKILSGHLVFLGPRSSAADFYYGPIYFYFITPFLWLFNYDPVGPAVFIALVGIATVYLVYYVSKKMFNESAGLFAAALYTVSPLVLAYSRSSWNPNPMPFVSLLTFYFIYKSIRENSRKPVLFAGILLGIAMQLQYLAVFLSIIAVVFLLSGLFFISKIRNILIVIKRLLYLTAGFLIGWSPFLVFEIRHGFPNLKTIINFMLYGNPDSPTITQYTFFQNIWNALVKLFARLITRYPPIKLTGQESPLIFVWLTVSILLGILAIAVLYKSRNKLAVLMLSIWFYMGVFLFGFYKKDIYDYYLGFMFTLPFLLIGNLLSQIYLSSKLKIAGKSIAVVVFLILFIFNLYDNPFRFAPNRQKDQVKKIAEFVISKTANKPYNFALITQGNSDHAYRYYLELEKHAPIEIMNEAIDPKRNTVTDQLMVVCESTDCQPLGNNLWEVAGFGRAEIDGEWNVSVVKVIRLIHYQNRDL